MLSLRIKTIVLTLIVCCFSFLLVSEANAQLAIKLETNETGYMLYEPVVVRLTIINRAGYPLPFSPSASSSLQANIYFSLVVNRKSITIDPLDSVLTGGFVIAPGQSHQIVFNLADYAYLREIGTYRFRAFVKHSMMKSAYQSSDISFTINSGKVLAKKQFGVVDQSDPTKPVTKIVQRTATLAGLQHKRKYLYYLVIEDDEKIYTTRRVGFVYDSNMQRYFLTDNACQIHILTMASPKLWLYQVYGPDGDFIRKEVIYVEDSSPLPRLSHDKESNVIKTGGRLAQKNEYMETDDNEIIQLNSNPQLNNSL